MTPLIQRRKNSMKTLNRRRRGGAVTILVAGSMVVLCGMSALAVDYGLMVSTKNQLQRSCDAAALAALQYLPGSQDDARTAAVFYARQNGEVVVNRDAVTFPTNFRVKVPAVRNVSFLFAPILPGSPKNGNVRASASAAVQLRDRLDTPAVAPLGITEETYATGLASGLSVNIRLIEQNKEGLGLNELVAMDLRDDSFGKSPAKLEDQLKWDTSFSEPTYIGHAENTLNSDDQAQAGVVDDGIQSRFDAAAALGDDGTKYGNIPYGSPRVLYIIITPSTPDKVVGTNMAPVLGFVPVYVEGLSITKTAGATTVLLKVRMLPPHYDTGHYRDGGGYSDATAGSPTSLRISRLVE